MRVLIVTPAARGSRTGNRVTARRWARLLRHLGHRVRVATRFDGQRADVLMALHAHRSADAVEAFRRARPSAGIVVALTGTDLYRDLPESDAARASLEVADAIIVLQRLAVTRLPPELRGKAQVVHQSVEPLPPQTPRKRTFDVCVIGHLRDEKDPLRAAEAARSLPPSSRIRVVQVGGALSDVWARRAEREMATNPRFSWLGERPRAEARRILARSRLMVLPSRMEGGANVIGEAVVDGVPIVASRIEGTTGLLGTRFPGLFDVGDTVRLRELMLRAETDPRFIRTLQQAGERVSPLFTPQHEREGLERLFDILAEGHGRGG